MATTTDPAGSGPLEGRLRLLHRTVQETGTPVLVLRQQASLAWLLGARSHVPYTLDRSWFDVIVDLSSTPTLTVVANRIEAPRLRDTELADLDVTWQVIPWWEDREAHLPTGPQVGTDLPYPGAQDASASLRRTRRVLLPDQANGLRQVCRESAQVATSLVGRVHPRMTEHEVAGLVAEGLLAHGMDPVTLLVAGGTRMEHHRHPLPLDRPVGDRVTMVFCGRRHGLISAVTRTISLVPLSTVTRDAYTRLLEVERAFLDRTVPGRPIGEVVAAGTAAYAAHGFDRDEWHRHHQGGFSGWESREYSASPWSEDIIPEGSCLAWNPSAAGVKVEDTLLVRQDGPELLVDDGVWPTVMAGGRRRPGIVEA